MDLWLAHIGSGYEVLRKLMNIWKVLPKLSIQMQVLPKLTKLKYFLQKLYINMQVLATLSITKVSFAKTF